MIDWVIILAIALSIPIVYFILRGRNQRSDKSTEDEDRWAESLSDDDVQDIYGDREDRWKSDD